MSGDRCRVILHDVGFAFMGLVLLQVDKRGMLLIGSPGPICTFSALLVGVWVRASTLAGKPVVGSLRSGICFHSLWIGGRLLSKRP